MWHVTYDMRNVTCNMWHNYKYSLLSLHMKTKVVQHVPRINISISHITCDMWKAKCDMWHNYKYSLLSLHMKTKVVQHVPRINISMSQTQSQVPSCCRTKFDIFKYLKQLTIMARYNALMPIEYWCQIQLPLLRIFPQQHRCTHPWIEVQLWQYTVSWTIC